MYVSDDGGAYTLWQSDTTATSATYTGQVGHTYRFYSVATDPLGLVQPTPSSAQATTTRSGANLHRRRHSTADPPPAAASNRAPLVTVTSAQVETIKVGKGKKAKKETVLVLDFSGALNAGAATNGERLRARADHQGQGDGQGQEPEAGRNQARRARDAGLGSLHRVERQRDAHSPRQAQTRRSRRS